MQLQGGIYMNLGANHFSFYGLRYNQGHPSKRAGGSSLYMGSEGQNVPTLPILAGLLLVHSGANFWVYVSGCLGKKCRPVKKVIILFLSFGHSFLENFGMIWLNETQTSNILPRLVKVWEKSDNQCPSSCKYPLRRDRQQLSCLTAYSHSQLVSRSKVPSSTILASGPFPHQVWAWIVNVASRACFSEI